MPRKSKRQVTRRRCLLPCCPQRPDWPPPECPISASGGSFRSPNRAKSAQQHGTSCPILQRLRICCGEGQENSRNAPNLCYIQRCSVWVDCPVWPGLELLPLRCCCYHHCCRRTGRTYAMNNQRLPIAILILCVCWGCGTKAPAPSALRNAVPDQQPERVRWDYISDSFRIRFVEDVSDTLEEWSLDRDAAALEIVSSSPLEFCLLRNGTPVATKSRPDGWFSNGALPNTETDHYKITVVPVTKTNNEAMSLNAKVAIRHGGAFVTAAASLDVLTYSAGEMYMTKLSMPWRDSPDTGYLDETSCCYPGGKDPHVGKG